MQKLYQLEIIEENQTKKIDFANNTDSFVEVVFTIDNKEVKDGRAFSDKTRGYCFPPGYRKDIKKMKNSEHLPFSSSGTVKAYVFTGKGEYKMNDDYNVPTFIRKKLGNQSALFKRDNNSPAEILEKQY